MQTSVALAALPPRTWRSGYVLISSVPPEASDEVQ